MIFVVIAAAAAAVQPGNADLQDMHCVASFSAMYSLAMKPEDKEKMLSSMLYFAGKIDGRSPGFDLAGHVGSLLQDPEYTESRLVEDLRRCSAEILAREADLKKVSPQLPDVEVPQVQRVQR